MGMFYQAAEGTVPFGNTEMEYIRFGSGSKNLVMLPGLGDGLRTMKGTAIPIALMYRIFARDYTVYMFSRKNQLTEGYTTRDMARDQAQAMEYLGIDRADVVGVSMGGMIAQHLAADYPEKVGKLVLVVTAPCVNPMIADCVTEWINQAKAGDHTALMDSNMRKIYSEGYYRKNKWMVPLIGKLTKPKSYNRFLVQANACLTHNACECLGHIQSPTLVIGGEQDQILGAEPSREIAAAIPHARLHIYDQWGHGLYEEEKDFNRFVLAYLNA